MLSNYIKLALRNLAKNRLYAFINIAGFSLGLTIFLFSTMLVRYELNHDNMFAKRDRIFTAGTIFSPAADMGQIKEYPVVRTAFAPFFELEIEGLEQLARAIHRKRVITINNDHYYQSVRYADSGFTRIFDFDYIYGDETGIDDPRGIILTENLAKKLFGRIDVLGEVITLDHQYDMHVTAVIKNIAADSHFNSLLMPDFELEAIASLKALIGIGDFKYEGNWEDLYPMDMTYFLLPENRDEAWLQQQIETVAARHAPEDERKMTKGYKVMNLSKVNTQAWDALGVPIIESMQLLGILILLIVCVNYTNLATAQNFGRTREIGLRKTLGAERHQLLLQFLIESITLTLFAMLIAVAGIEMLIPAFNIITGKAVVLDYFDILPWLVLTTLIVGLLAGAYPAYLISRLGPIESLRGTIVKGRKGNMFRGFMIGVQFAISIFILAIVLVITFQNEKVKELGNVFPKSQTIVMERLNRGTIPDKHKTLKQELGGIEGVESVTLSSDVPFGSTGTPRRVSPVKGDESGAFSVYTVSADKDFMRTFNIDVLAGRSFDGDNTGDLYREDVEQVRVIVNESAAEKLGFSNINDALGRSFHLLLDKDNPTAREFTIIGVIPDLYFRGLILEIYPMAFYIREKTYSLASVRLKMDNVQQVLNDIDDVWKRVVDDYPIQRQFLDFYFNLFFRIPKTINSVLMGFAVIGLSLTLIGLFGLAAFIAQQRTKEIGIRKVMGASVGQITRLLIWQFSKPVMWSLLFAVPLAYLASNLFLNLFAERIDFVFPLVVIAGLMGILAAWSIVASHAINIAKATPIRSLRYE